MKKIKSTEFSKAKREVQKQLVTCTLKEKDSTTIFRSISVVFPLLSGVLELTQVVPQSLFIHFKDSGEELWGVSNCSKFSRDAVVLPSWFDL